MQETLVRFLGREGSLEKGKATHSSVLGPPCGSAGKESACNAGDLGLIPGLGRYPGKGKGYPLQYSGLENSMDNPRGCRELDMTEWLALHYEPDKCWSLSLKYLRTSHKPDNYNKYRQMLELCQVIFFFFLNLRKIISMLECKGKVIRKRKNFLPYTLRMIFQTLLMGHTMRPINQSLRKRAEPSSIQGNINKTVVIK